MVDFYLEIQQLSNSNFKYLNYWSTKMLIFKVFVICLKFKKFIIKNIFFFHSNNNFLGDKIFRLRNGERNIL